MFSTQVSSAAETEAVTGQKLVKGHAYSVTGVEEVKSGGGSARAISHDVSTSLEQPREGARPPGTSGGTLSPAALSPGHHTGAASSCSAPGPS